jgi:conjugative transfer region protein TrbK
MTHARAFNALALATTIGVFVVAACTIQLHGEEESSPKPVRTRAADRSDLVRCASLTSEQTASYQHCQQVWAESRRRFFGKGNRPATTGRGDPVVDLAPAAKDQSRMPQGYPSIATPEVEER